jgi:hypothetical protein
LAHAIAAHAEAQTKAMARAKPSAKYTNKELEVQLTIKNLYP